MQTGLPAERLAREIGAGERHSPQAEQRGREQSDREQRGGGWTDERPESARRVGGVADRSAGHPDRRGAGDDDERGDEVGEQTRAERDVRANRTQVACAEAFVGDIRLDERLSPGRDRGADDADERQEVGARPGDLGDDHGPRGMTPVGIRQGRRHGVGDGDARADRHEGVLDAAEAAARKEDDDDRRGHGRGEIG